MIILNDMASYDNMKVPDVEIDYQALNDYYKLINNRRELTLETFKNYYQTFILTKAQNCIKNDLNNDILETMYKSCYSTIETKGLGLVGISGVGKSTYFDYLNSINADNFDNNTHRLKYVSIRDISGAYQNGGIKEVENLCSPVYNTKIDCLYIDDLGKEEVLMTNYGNKEDVMKKLIDFRYTIYKDTNGKQKLFFTSNYTLEFLKKRYTEIYFSRLYEMCKIVNINGKNLRYL
jgi:DNA replication protein DnaC